MRRVMKEMGWFGVQGRVSLERRYPIKAAAKAADRLRAVERKAAATKALREGHPVGGKDDGGSPWTLRELMKFLPGTTLRAGPRSGPPPGPPATHEQLYHYE
ncbi:hypothetical protein V494_00162 [Pseudogymnoascus sp. VKM F-4513 (FW-928)]|nr:hypothetical protein V494_00162 [Pseudogymnoascus sp. VKM F-4513 (FW-928)]